MDITVSYLSALNPKVWLSSYSKFIGGKQIFKFKIAFYYILAPAYT